jgi:pimeloyl-ACP methyl ester carboxylesterase
MRRLLVLEGLLYLAIVAAAVAGRGSLPAAALACVALSLGLRVILVVAKYVVAIAAEPRAPLAWLRSFACELPRFLAVYYWRVPFGRGRARWPRGGDGPLVLLVHGFMCNSAVLWPLARRLAQDARARVHGVDLGPPFADIEVMAAALAARMRELAAEAGEAGLVVIGHSMGGLIARRALVDPELVRATRVLVTLGSPHHGTRAARLAGMANVRQMRRGSPWLAGLPPHAGIPVVALFSREDALVTPSESAVLPGARAVACPGTGHFELIDGRRAYPAILEAVEEGARVVPDAQAVRP